MTKTIITFAAIISVMTTSSIAGEHTLGELRLSDDEWSVTKSGPTNTRLTNGSTGMVLVAHPTNYGGDKMNAFKAFARSMGAGADLNEWKINAAMTEGGYDVLYAAEFIKPSGVRTYVVPVAVFSGDKMAMIALFDPGYKGKQQLKESFGALLSSVQFTDNQNPQSGPGVGERLDGFYAAMGSKTGVSALAQITVEAGVNGLWMQPDGRFALTESGIKGDFNAYCAKYPKNCGRYQLADGEYKTWRMATKLETMLQLYRMKSKPYGKDGRDIKIGNARYRHVAPLTDHRLNGDYHRISADAQTGPADDNRSGFAETSYGFTKDGKFVKGGSISMFSSSSGTSVLTAGDKGVRSGSYKINGYSLGLTFDGGEKQTKAFFMMGDTPVIEGDMYGKRK